MVKRTLAINLILNKNNYRTDFLRAKFILNWNRFKVTLCNAQGVVPHMALLKRVIFHYFAYKSVGAGWVMDRF